MTDTALRIFQGLHNVAGAPSVLAAALREKKQHAESICFNTGHAAYPTDIVLSNDSDSQRKAQGKALLKRTLKEFDVFHFHYGESILGTSLADIPILKQHGKKVFFHFHGCDIRDSKRMFEVGNSPCRACWPMGCSANRNVAIEMANKYADGVFVSTPDLLQYIPKSELFLQPLDPAHLQALTSKATFIDLPDEGAPIRIAHAPSNRTMKGTHHVVEAVEQLKKHFNVTLDVIENVSNVEVVERFRSAHIVIDQMYTGCYGTVSVEAMAVGRPVLSHIRDSYADLYPSDLPIISVSNDTLYPILRAMLNDPEHLNMVGYESREYVLRHHDVSQSVTELLAKYRQSNVSS